MPAHESEREWAEQGELESAARKLYVDAGGDAERLASVAAEFQRAMATKAGDGLSVRGSVSVVTGRPYVELTWGENVGQLSVEEARAQALLELEAAQNAVADAALFAFARDGLGLDLDDAATAVDVMRRYRANRWGDPHDELGIVEPTEPSSS